MIVHPFIQYGLPSGSGPYPKNKALINDQRLFFFEAIFACCFHFLGFFNHPSMRNAFAHDFRMLLCGHRRYSHQIFQQGTIGIVVLDNTTQVLHSYR